MRDFRSVHIISAVLVLAGLALPGDLILGLLRQPPAGGFTPELQRGAVLFKVSLVVLGVYLFLIKRLLVRGKRYFSGSGHPPSGPVGAGDAAAVAVLLAVALALRLHGIGEGLWYDEILTYVDLAGLPFGEIVTNYASQNQHMLYTLLAHASFDVFGQGALGLRLPAALFGVGSVLVLYLLGTQVAGRREAFLASALMTFSYHHVWFSQNGRGYTGLLFWTILTTYLLLRALDRGRAALWVAFAAASALGAYTHMTMVFVTAGQLIVYALIVFSKGRGDLAERTDGLFAGFILAGLFTIVLYSLVIPQITGGPAVGEGARSTVSEWKNPLWTLLELVRGLRISFAGGAAAAVAGLLFTAGVISYARRNITVLLVFFLPAVVGLTAVKVLGHPVWPRFFFFTMGFLCLVIIRGALVVPEALARFVFLEQGRSRHAGTVVCSVIIILSAVSVPAAYAPKQDYAGALAYIEERAAPGDSVVTVGITSTVPYRRLYGKDWPEVESPEGLAEARSAGTRTWVVFTTPMYLKSAYPELMEIIERDFAVQRGFGGTLNDGTVYVAMAGPPAPGHKSESRNR